MFVAARKTILGLVMAVATSVLTLSVLAVGAGVGAALSDPCTDAGGTPGVGNPGQLTCTFSTPNSVATPSYAFTLPGGAGDVSVEVQGGQGGLSGGKGADASASFSALGGGTTLTIVVGAKGQDLCMASPPMFLPCGGGFPDGGAGGFGSASYSGGGGGSTRVSSPSELLIVAGAGGGAGVGGGAGGDANSDGGAGAGITGATGGSGGKGASGPTPGSGGAEGTGSCGAGSPGTAGTAAGQGGNGGWNSFSATSHPAGGGGGGYAGGGGGGGGGATGSCLTAETAFGGGGGGGSSFTAAGATNVSIDPSAGTGDGRVVITYTSPSAVTFVSASATRIRTGILLRWRTAAQVDLLGFRVYRSRGHSWKRVTPSLIAAKGSVAGVSYRFLDRTARRGVSYRYRIRAVNRDGTAAWFGPVRVT